jgi:hypothetical protein
LHRVEFGCCDPHRYVAEFSVVRISFAGLPCLPVGLQMETGVPSFTVMQACSASSIFLEAERLTSFCGECQIVGRILKLAPPSIKVSH